MNREFYLKSVCDGIATLCYQVEARNAINLYDINLISEDFYSKLLNRIFRYNLKNLNIIDRNVVAIDLGDEINKIAIQVTSDNSSEKIKKTIGEFIEHKHYTIYDRLIVILLTKKKKYTTEFNTEDKFSFDKKNDILDNTDLIREIRKLEIQELKELSAFIEEELTNKIEKIQRSQANEVETIIELIEYLTKNRICSEKRDTVIDPDYKILKRFNAFSNRIINEYKTLLVVYGEAIDIVNSLMPIDEAQEIIIQLYLQDISIKFLDESDENPISALNKLVDYFEDKISTYGKRYDKAAIKFYLINEIVKCNVFPNERADYIAN